MRWFRFYDDALNDPKVQRLPAELFRGWINLLCIASKHGGEIPSDPQALAFLLHTTEQKASSLVASLISAQLLDLDEQLRPHNWDDRQYASDSAAERMRRHRQRKRDVTSDVTVTPQIQIQKQIQKEEPPLVPPAGGNPKERSVVRRNKTRIPDDWCFDPAARQIFLDAGISYSLEQPAFRDHHAAAGSLFLDWDAAGRKWARNAVKFAAERSGNQRQRTGPSRAVGLAEAMADVLATGAGKAQRAGDPGCPGTGDSAVPASGSESGTQWNGPSIDVVDLGGGAFGVPAGRGDNSPQDVGEDREMVADAGGDPIGVHVAGGAQETNAPNASGLAGIVVPIPVFLRRG